MINAEAIRGYIDIFILSQLLEHPSYAYAIGKTITDMAKGEYTMKQTTLYSALKRLEAAGQVEAFPGESASGKPRTYYRITPTGLSAFRAKCAEWQQTKTIVDRFTEGTL